jgi:hypothetical protein
MIMAIRFYMKNESVKFHKDIHNSAFIHILFLQSYINDHNVRYICKIEIFTLSYYNNHFTLMWLEWLKYL